MSVAVPAPRRPPISAGLILAGVAVLSATLAAGAGYTKYAAGALVVLSVLAAAHERLLRMPALVTGMLIVILFIPVNRYELPASFPFQIEPYRVMMVLLIAIWISSMLIDPRVRARRTGLEGPLALIVFAVLGSELANPGRVGDLTSYVVKALTFFASFVLVVYFIVSVVRDRAGVDRMIRMLAGGGAFIALAAVFERRTQFNVFDHLQGLVPLVSYHPVAQEMRNGAVRAVASAGHPIELAAVLAMLLPLAVYLALSTGKRRWWAAAAALLLGDFTSGSRTGFIGLVIVALTFLCLRPRETRRFWPALLPGLVLLHFAVPGALGGIKGAFFPAGGLVAEQQHVVNGDGRLANNRLADWGPSLAEFSRHNPLVGEGFGTRVTGFGTPHGNAAILDNQWLRSFLEIGILGVAGWLWLVGRSVRRLARRAREQRGSPDGWLPVALAAGIAAFAVEMFTYDALSFILGAFLLYTFLALGAVVVRLPAQEPHVAARS